MAREYHYTKLLLVRHAQARSPDGTYGPDTPLSALGVRQSQMLAAVLKACGCISAIYCSPYRRARQTAEPAASLLNVRAIVDPAIAEFQIAAKPLEVLVAARTDVTLWRPEHRGAPDGETILEFFMRVNRFCDKVCQIHRDETIAVVTHAGTVDAIYRWAVGVPPDRPWTFEVEIGNASISEVEVWPFGRSEGGPPSHTVLHSIGESSHLADVSSKI